MNRSCSFQVSSKKEKQFREKELLLIAHDRLGMEFHTRSIEDLLDDFSSDSLESESSRKCVSDFPVGRQRHDSDTDYSGLNSLQGSGDLLEMLEEEESQPESMRSSRRGDAFYVEIDESPRRHKPILRARSLPGKRNLKPVAMAKPDLKKGAQTKSRLSMKCNLTLLPSKTTQGRYLRRPCLRRFARSLYKLLSRREWRLVWRFSYKKMGPCIISKSIGGTFKKKTYWYLLYAPFSQY